jgi:NADPH:quinone reductase-like Zn-dependent oxidoreductase
MGFRSYTVVQTNMASELPDDMTFEKAAVIPLGYSTAASELFQDEFLNLQMLTELKRKDPGRSYWFGVVRAVSGVMRFSCGWVWGRYNRFAEGFRVDEGA